MTSDESRVVAVRVERLDEAAAWAEFLTVSEGEKAERMANDILRARFVVSRGLRRELLAQATGRTPRELEFVEEEGRKPRLLDGDGWDFNLSHAGDYVAVVVGPCAVGIDLERKRPVREMTALVRRYFHRDEVMAWERLPEEVREDGFFTLWSAREAAMKCAGFGLARGMSMTRVDPSLLEELEAGAQVGDLRLSLRRWEAPEGYTLVVAIGDTSLP